MPALVSTPTGHAPISGRPASRAAMTKSSAPDTDARSSDAGTLPPAVTVTLSGSTRLTSERVLVYGRPSAAGRSRADTPPDVQDADPARMLDRKIAEGQKEVAAIQIRQTKIAAKHAGVLALLNPAGGLSFAKHAAKTLSNAMETFGKAESAIRRTEDESVAEMDPEVLTAIARDVYEQTSALGFTEEGRQEVDAAIARRLGRPAAPATEVGSDATNATVLTVSTRIEAVSVVRIEDDSDIAARAAAIGADRSKRMGQDAEVIKDGISGLRYLDRIIDLSIRRLQETGRLKAAAMRDAAEARTAWHDAVASTASAAMPVVQAGYGITPDADD